MLNAHVAVTKPQRLLRTLQYCFGEYGQWTPDGLYPSAVHHDSGEDVAEDVFPADLVRRQTMPLADLMNLRFCHHVHTSRCCRFSSYLCSVPALCYQRCKSGSSATWVDEN